MRTCMDILQEADLAAAPLTATSTRERVVDFTHPFMSTSIIAALMKKRHAAQLGIRSVADLSRQSTMKYGTLDGGSTKHYFRTSRRLDYHRMWAEMTAANNSFVRTYDEGIQRVLASSDEHPWAFMGEGAFLSYATMHRCDMTVVTSDVWGSSSHYALALPVGSPYTERLSVAIMEMKESHYLEMLGVRWFQSADCDHSANDAA